MGGGTSRGSALPARAAKARGRRRPPHGGGDGDGDGESSGGEIGRSGGESGESGGGSGKSAGKSGGVARASTAGRLLPRSASGVGLRSGLRGQVRGAGVEAMERRMAQLEGAIRRMGGRQRRTAQLGSMLFKGGSATAGGGSGASNSFTA